MADNPNPAKVAKVAEIREKLESSDAIIVTEYRGLDVPAQAELRSKISEAGGEFKIYKNTLTRRAADEAGVDLGAHLTGPTALAFARRTDDGPGDPVSLSKALQDFSDDNEMLVIKGGIMDAAPIGPDDVKALSKVPPREVMLAKFAGLLQAPMANFARLLKAMPQELANLLKALVEKGGGSHESPAEATVGDEAGDAEQSDTENAAETTADDAAVDATESEAAEADETAAEAPADDSTNEAEDEDAADEAASDDTEA